MSAGRRITILSGAAACSLGLMIFSFFIHYKFPVRLVSFAALLATSFVISKNIRTFRDLKKIFSEDSSLYTTIIYTIIGVGAGIVASVQYRGSLNISMFPESIHLFVIPAALIGCMEELVFRGFIQVYVNRINGTFSVLFSTLSHTGYKCFLFLAPAVSADINIGYLAFYTFIAGIILGTIRNLSKSLLPSLAAHAIFDILVYAEAAVAPWWVW